MRFLRNLPVAFRLTPTLAAFTASSILLAACATRTGERITVRHALGEQSPAESSRFAAGRLLLAGFDPLSEGGESQPGDRVLLGMELQRGAQTQVWYLRITLLETDEPERARRGTSQLRHVPIGGGPDIESTIRHGYMPVLAELFDERLNLVSARPGFMPDYFMTHGLFDTVEVSTSERARRIAGRLAAAERGEPQPTFAVSREVNERWCAGMLSVVRMPDVIQADDRMAQVLWQIVEKPSIVSILRHAGVHVSLTGRFADLTPTRTVVAGEPRAAYRVPIDAIVNNAPALRCELLVTRVEAPLGLFGGIVGLAARHPSDPGRRFEIVLLAARRGETGAIASR